MSAPKGNQFWKLRSKHGRDKIFSSPEILLEACLEYFEETDKRKWKKIEYHGKDATQCVVPNETPYTITGLYIFLGIGRETWYEYKKRQDYSEVIAHIENIIFTQKFEGAAVGAFNSSIIARDLGLAEKRSVDVKTEQPLFGD